MTRALENKLLASVQKKLESTNISFVRWDRNKYGQDVPIFHSDNASLMARMQALLLHVE